MRLLEHTKQITDIVTRVVEDLGTLREPQTSSVVNRLLSSPHWQFGYDESESKKHYSINIYRTAIGYYRYVLGRGEGDHVQEQYEPFMWYEPSHDTVRNVFDAAEETCARLVTENVHNERRRVAALLLTIETCLGVLSNEHHQANYNRTSELRSALEDILRKCVDLWIEETETEAYRSEISSIIEQVERQYCGQESNTAALSLLKDVHAQCYVKKLLSEEDVLKIMSGIVAKKAERQQLRWLCNIVDAIRKLLLSVEGERILP